MSHLGALDWQLLKWKAINSTYSECVFAAIGIQHAIRMRHIVVLVFLSLSYFYSWRAWIWGKKIEHKMFVSIFSTIFFSEVFIILRRTGRDIIINVHGFSC